MSASKVSLPKVSSYISEAFQIRTQVNPDYHKAESESFEWFDKFELYTGDKRRMFLDSGIILACALCCPKADYSRFRITSDFSLAFFSFEDMLKGGNISNHEEMKGAIDAVMRVVHDPSAPTPSFKPAAMLQSCFQRMAQHASPALVQRIVTGLDEYIETCFQERLNRSMSTIPDLDEYIKQKRGTGAAKVFSSMLQFRQSLDLPDQVINDQSVSELTAAGCDIFVLVRELCSSIPAMRGTDSLNILSVVMHHNKDLDLNGAIEFVDQMIKKRVEEYLSLKTNMTSFGPDLDEQVAEFAQAMENSIHGFVETIFSTPMVLGNQAKSAKETGVVNLDMLAPAQLGIEPKVERSNLNQ
ncbi:isoprenoid synthase domain-containing protein [Rhizoctonia solani]|nr:isoprenoid synthase domain-containing protein [Rhizoctonia solani]